MYRDIPELRPVPVHGHGRIWPCPCTGTDLDSGMSLYMDRAIFGPVPYLSKGYVLHYDHYRLIHGYDKGIHINGNHSNHFLVYLIVTIIPIILSSC
jgi:hypothetical protein